jgi:signal peptidase II
MRLAIRAALIALFLVGCVGCDQTSKAIVRHAVPPGVTHIYLGGVFRIQRAENPGAFLSIGESLPRTVREFAFTVGVGMLVVGLSLWAVLGKNLPAWRRLGLAAIAAGGIGNLIDRVLQDGTVTDFLYLGLGPVHTGIFNFADVTLMLGLAALLLEQPLIALVTRRGQGT